MHRINTFDAAMWAPRVPNAIAKLQTWTVLLLMSVFRLGIVADIRILLPLAVGWQVANFAYTHTHAHKLRKFAATL